MRSESLNITTYNSIIVNYCRYPGSGEKRPKERKFCDNWIQSLSLVSGVDTDDLTLH